MTNHSKIPLTSMLREQLDSNSLCANDLLSITKNAVQGTVNQYASTGRVPGCAALDDAEVIWLMDAARMRNGERQKLVTYLSEAADQLPRGYVSNSYRRAAAMMSRAPDFVTETGFDN